MSRGGRLSRIWSSLRDLSTASRWADEDLADYPEPLWRIVYWDNHEVFFRHSLCCALLDIDHEPWCIVRSREAHGQTYVRLTE